MEVSILIASGVPWTHLDALTDPSGRYLFLEGQIGGVKVTFANFYTPNEHQDTFLNRHLAQLLTYAEGQLIIGGDLNIPLIPTEDTSSKTSSTPLCTRNCILKSLHTAQLIDAWRLLHPGERDYTFYLGPHQKYSRIDYFLIPHSQLHAIKEITIGPITWSDHAPVIMWYGLSDGSTTQPKSCKLNESLLQNPEVLKEVVREMGHYFHTNDTQNEDTGLIWEAHKAVIRGILIKPGTRIKRQRTTQLTALLSNPAQTCPFPTPRE